jgi:hypothetical protein
LLRRVEVQRGRDGIEAVILAGTELPLVMTDLTASSIPLLLADPGDDEIDTKNFV